MDKHTFLELLTTVLFILNLLILIVTAIINALNTVSVALILSGSVSYLGLKIVK